MDEAYDTSADGDLEDYPGNDDYDGARGNAKEAHVQDQPLTPSRKARWRIICLMSIAPLAPSCPDKVWCQF